MTYNTLVWKEAQQFEGWTAEAFDDNLLMASYDIYHAGGGKYELYHTLHDGPKELFYIGTYDTPEDAMTGAAQDYSEN